uniref:Uncharacterized protein n=1 Tax=Neobodo designis TaxID=312471 RepID=A0A7S1QXB4_NEODS
MFTLSARRLNAATGEVSTVESCRDRVRQALACLARFLFLATPTTWARATLPQAICALVVIAAFIASRRAAVHGMNCDARGGGGGGGRSGLLLLEHEHVDLLAVVVNH